LTHPKMHSIVVQRHYDELKPSCWMAGIGGAVGGFCLFGAGHASGPRADNVQGTRIGAVIGTVIGTAGAGGDLLTGSPTFALSTISEAWS
jgi:hypothetical protein